MSVTNALLKVLISVFGDEASANFILETNFLNKTEEEQIELISSIMSSETKTEKVENLAEEPTTAEEDKFPELEGFNAFDQVYEEMAKEEGSYLFEIETKKVSITKKGATLPAHKRHSNPPRDMAKYYAFKKIFGGRR